MGGFMPQSQCKYRAKLDKRRPRITHDLDADIINHGKNDNNAYTNSVEEVNPPIQQEIMENRE